MFFRNPYGKAFFLACVMLAFGRLAWSAEDTLILVAYGDNLTGFGNPSVHQALLKQMRSEKPAFVLHTGNMVASGGREEQWEQFLSEGKELFAQAPLKAVPGDQDLSRRGNLARYLKSGKTYYSFRVGSALLIALDTTRNFAPGSRQYRFLRETLESADPKETLLVFFHHPPFSGSLKGGDEKVVKHLVPLFEAHGVDLVISGEEHAYQRLVPVNGVTYLVTGGGGGPLYPVQADPALANYKGLYHYVVLEIGEGSIRGRMKDPRGVEEDRFEILTTGAPVPPERAQARPRLKKSQRYSIQ